MIDLLAATRLPEDKAILVDLCSILHADPEKTAIIDRAMLEIARLRILNRALSGRTDPLSQPLADSGGEL